METERAVSGEQPEITTQISQIIQSDHAGLRLDHFLVHLYPSLSRSQISSSIKKGHVRVNGAAAKASRKLHIADVVSGFIEEKKPLTLTPQRVDFTILYEDEHLLLLSKPPGLVVHPASGNAQGTLVNGLLHHYAKISEVGDPVRPGIVHRLDKNTSGIMVVAKNNRAHRQLVDIFKSRSVKKKYFAIVRGVPLDDKGRIVAPIGRHPVNRKKMSIRHQSGKHAATNWFLAKVLGKKYALLEIDIETGRTHQIRVHMASIGHPVAGDETYGPGKSDPLFSRQMLHSAEIRFDHPITGRKMVGKAPLWEDMNSVIEIFDNQDE